MDSELEPHDEFLAKKAAAIRRLVKNVARDVVEIGGHLAEAKEKCPHGRWLCWLREEFVWGDDTAIRLMRAADFIKSRNLRNFEDLGLCMVYLLSAPSTPEAARDKIISSFQAGETPTYSDARRTVQAYRTGIATRGYHHRLPGPRDAGRNHSLSEPVARAAFSPGR